MPYHDGGYCPQGISFENRTELALEKDKNKFKIMVDETLKAHYQVIKKSCRERHLFLRLWQRLYEGCF